MIVNKVDNGVGFEGNIMCDQRDPPTLDTFGDLCWVTRDDQE